MTCLVIVNIYIQFLLENSNMSTVHMQIFHLPSKIKCYFISYNIYLHMSHVSLKCTCINMCSKYHVFLHIHVGYSANYYYNYYYTIQEVIHVLLMK